MRGESHRPTPARRRGHTTPPHVLIAEYSTGTWVGERKREWEVGEGGGNPVRIHKASGSAAEEQGVPSLPPVTTTVRPHPGGAPARRTDRPLAVGAGWWGRDRRGRIGV